VTKCHVPTGRERSKNVYHTEKTVNFIENLPLSANFAFIETSKGSTPKNTGTKAKL